MAHLNRNTDLTFKGKGSLLSFFLFIAALVTSCDSGVTTGGGNTGSGFPNVEDDWLIPESELISAQGKDGIPSIDRPQFTIASQVDFIPDQRRVLGIKVGDEIRAYPIQIMDWHEIVNDQFKDKNVAVTFCPLTGTGIAWDRGESEFGVSGLLFRNNLIPYDRSTESHFSQMQMRAVQGPRAGNNVELIDIVETYWSTWKKMFPESLVLNTNTGFDREYQGVAYPGSRTSNGSAALFPVKYLDNRLEKNESVHGVVADETANEAAGARVYVLKDFGSEVVAVNDTLEGKPIVVAGSMEWNFAVSFYSVVNGDTLQFTAVNDSLPVIMKDQTGSSWNIFGEAVTGPAAGNKLRTTRSYTGFWFAWADFFPAPEIYTFK